jgi:glyoxylase I family protein
MTTQGFHHIALKAHDYDASVKFYTEGLGLTEKIAWGEGNSRGIMLETGTGNYVEIFAGGSAEPKPEGVLLHFAFRADDVDAAVLRAIAAGAEVTMAPSSLDIPSRPFPLPVRYAFVKGPDGELVEFFQNALT